MLSKILVIALILALCAASFMMGAAYGAKKTIEEGLAIAEQYLNIELSQRAKDMIMNNPHLLSLAIEADSNYTNPFLEHPQAKIRFDYCMLTVNDYERCYSSVSDKYGFNSSFPL